MLLMIVERGEGCRGVAERELGRLSTSHKILDTACALYLAIFHSMQSTDMAKPKISDDGRLDREERRQSRYSAQELHTSTHVFIQPRVLSWIPIVRQKIYTPAAVNVSVCGLAVRGAAKDWSEVWSGGLVASDHGGVRSGRFELDETWSSGSQTFGNGRKAARGSPNGQMCRQLRSDLADQTQTILTEPIISTSARHVGPLGWTKATSPSPKKINQKRVADSKVPALVCATRLAFRPAPLLLLNVHQIPSHPDGCSIAKPRCWPFSTSPHIHWSELPALLTGPAR